MVEELQTFVEGPDEVTRESEAVDDLGIAGRGDGHGFLVLVDDLQKSSDAFLG